MWKMLLVLALVAPATLASAQAVQTPPHQALQAAVLARPTAARSAADVARPAGPARLEAPPPAVGAPSAFDVAATGQAPARLRPAQRSEDVSVDFTFDSADPLDKRFSADRPGLLGLKGRVRF